MINDLKAEIANAEGKKESCREPSRVRRPRRAIAGTRRRIEIQRRPDSEYIRMMTSVYKTKN
jgi:hypothetical protein